MKTKLSIVVPLFNEAENIKLLFKKLNQLSQKLPKNTECIFVDDGSRDQSVKLLKATGLKYKKTIISFSKNFGHQSALLAGIKEAKGELVVTMDADLQHPPELILDLIKLSNQGYDIVLTKKIDKDVTKGFKKISSKLFYKFVNIFSQTKIHESASDFRLMNRKSLNALLALPESNKFLRGLVSWVGFKSVILPFEVKKRAYGESKYSLRKMLALAISGITSFSVYPLYLTGLLGLGLTVLSAFYTLYILYRYLTGTTVSGWASLLSVLLIIGSFIFIALGVIGVYLAKIYEEVKKRPDYIIKDIFKF